MLIKLVGYAHKRGEFTNDKEETIAYDNILLDVISDVPLDGATVIAQGGFHCSSIKIKYNQFFNLFGGTVKSVSDLNTWLNRAITLDYALLGAKPVLVGVRLCETK